MIKRDLGLYVHIPFCLKKCDYCGRYSKNQTASFINSTKEKITSNVKNNPKENKRASSKK